MKRKTAKEILAESLRELAGSKPVDKITISDIVGNCGYSTATFYRQFRDKYDLIAWSYSRDLEKILDQFSGDEASWRRALGDTAAYYSEHRDYMANLLLHTSGYDSFLRHMTEINSASITAKLLRSGERNAPGEETEMLIRHYVFGTVLLTCEWILGKYEAGPEQLAEVYAASMPEAMKRRLFQK